MRANEFEHNKYIHFFEVDESSPVDFETCLKLYERAVLRDFGILFEEVDRNLINTIDKISEISQTPIVGEEYIAIFVTAVNRQNVVINSTDHILKLIEIRSVNNEPILILKDNNGHITRFPDTRLSDTAYMRTMLFNNQTSYDKCRILLELQLEKHLPSVKFPTTLTESSTKETKEQFVDMFKKFLPLAMHYLKLKNLPKMEFSADVPDDHQPTFGKYEDDKHILHVALMNRHPVDILRTVAHELCHYKQDTEGRLNAKSGETGSPEENEAHIMAGIVMRHFNKKFPQFLNDKPMGQ